MVNNNGVLCIILMRLFVYLQTNVCLITYMLTKSINKMIYGINLQVQQA